MKRTATATLGVLAAALLSSCSLVLGAGGDASQDSTPASSASDLLAATSGDGPAAAVGAAGSNGRVSTARRLDTGVISEIELSLFFSDSLATLESRGAELLADDRAREEQQDRALDDEKLFDAALVMMTALLVEAGYSVEQITEATVFGEAVCTPPLQALVVKSNPTAWAPTSCSIPGVKPALTAQPVFSTAGDGASPADPASVNTPVPTETEPASGLAPGLYIGNRADAPDVSGPGATDDVSLVVTDGGYEVRIVSRHYTVGPVLNEDRTIQDCAFTIETTTFGVVARDDSDGRALVIPAVRSESIIETECPSKKPVGPTGPDEDVEVRGVIDLEARTVTIQVGPHEIALDFYGEEP